MKTYKLAVMSLLFAVATSAQASVLWTITAAGKITAGEDVAGVFGNAGQSLAGLDFVQSITVDVSPDAWTISRSSIENDYREGSGPSFTVATTVNGVTLQMHSIATLYSTTSIIDSGSLRGLPYFDSVGASLFGYTGSGDILQASNVISGSNGIQSGIQYAFLPTSRFDQSFYRAIDPSTWNMEAFLWATPIDENHAQNKARFDSESISFLAVTVTELPEPSSIALICFALTGLGFARRRKM